MVLFSSLHSCGAPEPGPPHTSPGSYAHHNRYCQYIWSPQDKHSGHLWLVMADEEAANNYGFSGWEAKSLSVGKEHR